MVLLRFPGRRRWFGRLPPVIRGRRTRFSRPFSAPSLTRFSSPSLRLPDGRALVLTTAEGDGDQDRARKTAQEGEEKRVSEGAEKIRPPRELLAAIDRTIFYDQNSKNHSRGGGGPGGSRIAGRRRCSRLHHRGPCARLPPVIRGRRTRFSRIFQRPRSRAFLRLPGPSSDPILIAISLRCREYEGAAIG